MVARIPTVEERSDLPEEDRSAYDKVFELQRGAVKGAFTVLLHSPNVALRYAELSDYVRFDSPIDRLLKEFIYIGVARIFDCQSIWSAHVQWGMEAGLSKTTVDAVRAKNRSGMTEDQVLIWDYMDQIFRTHRVSEDVFEAMRARWTLKEIVDIVGLVAYVAAQACVHNSFEIQARFPDRLDLERVVPRFASGGP